MTATSDGQNQLRWRFYRTCPRGVIRVADPSTIQRKGTGAKIWTMYEFAEADDQPFRPAQYFHELDCLKKRVRILLTYAYAEFGGEGKPVGYDRAPSPCQPTTPGNVGEVV